MRRFGVGGLQCLPVFAAPLVGVINPNIRKRTFPRDLAGRDGQEMFLPIEQDSVSDLPRTSLKLHIVKDHKHVGACDEIEIA